MKPPVQTRGHDLTWLELYRDDAFQEFFKGYLSELQKRLKQTKVHGSSQYRYSCGQVHDWKNNGWDPFKILSEYCAKTGYDFYVAKDIIEEKIGRRLECECQILNDEKAIRRRQLQASFGVDFGEPGRREVDVY